MRRMILILALVSGVALAATAILLVGTSGGGASADAAPTALTGPVTAAVPDGTLAIVPAASADPRGLELVVTPPPEEVSRKSSDPFAYGDLSWRASMIAASVATDRPELGEYRLAAPSAIQVTVPSAALGLVQGSLPPAEEAAKLTRLGTVSADAALAQMKSNLEVLQGALPPGTLRSTELEIVPVDSSRDRFAIAVVLDTESRDALIKQIGDVTVGLQTGLVGGVEATVEGLSITATEGGEPILASWIAARAMAGTTMVAPGIDPPPVQSTSVDFPNLTDGPAVAASGEGAGAEQSELPTNPQVHLEGRLNSVDTRVGWIVKPDSGSIVGPEPPPHLRPRLKVRPGDLVRVTFTAPGAHVKAMFRRPGDPGEQPIRVARVNASRASENGLRWSFRVPSWSRIKLATLIRIYVTYNGAYGRYDAGVLPLRRH
jgi:hypothetical protein